MVSALMWKDGVSMWSWVNISHNYKYRCNVCMDRYEICYEKYCKAVVLRCTNSLSGFVFF